MVFHLKRIIKPDEDEKHDSLLEDFNNSLSAKSMNLLSTSVLDPEFAEVLISNNDLVNRRRTVESVKGDLSLMLTASQIGDGSEASETETFCRDDELSSSGD